MTPGPKDNSDPLDSLFQGESDFSFDAEDFEGHQVTTRADPLSYPVHEYLDAAKKAHQESQRTQAPPPRLPFLIGVFEFPWYPSSLQCLIPMSLAMLGTTLLFVLLFIGLAAGPMAVRALAPSAFMALVFTLAYTFACGLKVVEETAGGEDKIEDWPAVLEWKEWAWSLVFVTAMLLESAVAALVLTIWAAPFTWVPTIVLTYFVFPYVLLSSLEADAWVPTSKVVWKTLRTRAWAWGLFYLESTGTVLVWMFFTLLGLLFGGWWFVFVACPLLGVVALIYARLLGRLAWCCAEDDE